MSKLHYALLILLIAAGGKLLAQPKLEIVGGSVINFGTIEPSKDIYDTLIVKNIGTGILHIIGIDPTCGCTTALADTNIIPAGKSVRILVKIVPADLPGEIIKTIQLLTNDLQKPIQEIDFKFRIRHELAFRPQTIGFSGCRVNQPCTASVTIYNESDTATFMIVGSTTTMKGLRSLMHDNIAIPPHDSLVYKVELLADSEGYRLGRFNIYTSSTMNPVQAYDVYANVADANGNPPPPLQTIFNDEHNK
ncbi:MAG TPA: DUF1573 domain-containing protein [Candidatus Kapabacteria bacterium]|nr:DUF1573 domain-containing protein [Candidatus Kapabacteria bacterium]